MMPSFTSGPQPFDTMPHLPEQARAAVMGWHAANAAHVCG
jgi:hypothetical protein